MKLTIVYWVFTALLALGYVSGGIADLAQPDSFVQETAKLGYPAHFFRILGFWKLVGAVVVLLPALPRAKEWAYAGFVINLTGALAAHQAIGDPPGDFAPPLILLGFAAVSWVTRPASRRLPGPWL